MELFDEVTYFLSLLFEAVKLVDANSVEGCRYVRARLVKFLLVVQVGFTVNLPLKTVNDGLVAVGGFLEN